ncbi:hypothetical protein CB1_094409003 [Camelus ferus]|nr:hypothetical protein CB1_094409003 [Camelus ferus]
MMMKSQQLQVRAMANIKHSLNSYGRKRTLGTVIDLDKRVYSQKFNRDAWLRRRNTVGRMDASLVGKAFRDAVMRERAGRIHRHLRQKLKDLEAVGFFLPPTELTI